MSMSVLKSRNILLGITGSIAAYKAVELVRELSREQASVTVVMTQNAQAFVGAATFQAITRNPVYTHLFNGPSEMDALPHIDLARRADAIVVAPATANFIGKMANGIADDLLSSMLLAAEKPLLVCPAMNTAMYRHPAVQENLARLRSYRYQVVEPESGALACGDQGPGRLANPAVICECVKVALDKKDLEGQHVLVTAGPTEEPIDPVRFLSNPSSGKMGYSIARVARRRGAKVVLVSGPTSLAKPWGVEFVAVRTAKEMREAVLSHFDGADVVIKAAAVADYGLPKPFPDKLKKKTAEMTLTFRRTPDILRELGRLKRHQILVGFAAETADLIPQARKKLKHKNLDLVVVNDVAAPGVGFGSDTNQVQIVTADNMVLGSPLVSKEEIAYFILDKVSEILEKKAGAMASNRRPRNPV